MKKYIKASFDNEIPDWLRNDKRALGALSRKGLDLKSVVITDAPTGRGRDYPIYHIKDGNWSPFIWIPGIYNDDYHLNNPGTGNYESVKYISKKYLPILDVVYVSKSDYMKSPKDRYKDPRYIYDKDGNGEYAGQYQHKAKFDSDELTWSTTGKRQRYGGNRDKSGYEIPNPDTKLQNFYLNSPQGSDRLASRIEKVYNILTDLKSRIFDVDFRDFGKDYKGNPDPSGSAYKRLMSLFGDACRDYRLALDDASRADVDGYWYVSSALKNAKSAEATAKRVEKILDTQFDW